MKYFIIAILSVLFVSCSTLTKSPLHDTTWIDNPSDPHVSQIVCYINTDNVLTVSVEGKVFTYGKLVREHRNLWRYIDDDENISDDEPETYIKIVDNALYFMIKENFNGVVKFVIISQSFYKSEK